MVSQEDLVSLNQPGLTWQALVSCRPPAATVSPTVPVLLELLEIWKLMIYVGMADLRLRQPKGLAFVLRQEAAVDW